VKTEREAKRLAQRLGYPVLLRPSYVLSGQAMRIVPNEESLKAHFRFALESSGNQPVLVDKFLEDAVELDVDALSDGNDCEIIGVMQHVEEAGIHSGDSTSILPPPSIPPEILKQIEEDTRLLAQALGVVGFMNVQMAFRGNKLYILEVNPRASRTIPFVSKARGIPFVKCAVQLIMGASLRDLKEDFKKNSHHFAVKTVVFPFKKLLGKDVLLGPEMKSTGEAMGIDADLSLALLKAYEGAGIIFPEFGTIFVSIRDGDKRAMIPIVRTLHSLGFRMTATEGTAKCLALSGIPVEPIRKIQEGSLEILDQIREGKIKIVINIPSYIQEEERALSQIRKSAILAEIPLLTTLSQAQFFTQALQAKLKKTPSVKSLQEYHHDWVSTIL